MIYSDHKWQIFTSWTQPRSARERLSTRLFSMTKSDKIRSFLGNRSRISSVFLSDATHRFSLTSILRIVAYYPATLFTASTISLIMPSACLLTMAHCYSPASVRRVSFARRISPDSTERERLSTRTSTRDLSGRDSCLGGENEWTRIDYCSE